MSIQLTSVRQDLQPKMSPGRDSVIDKLRIVLIKPSKYDDEGYISRFWKGVLPSNTLNVLHGLTEDVSERRLFGDLKIHEALGLPGGRSDQPVSPRIRFG